MMQLIDCVQGTPEWFKVRSGIPTASEFATVMANGKAGAESKTRATYMRKLAGEIITGDPMEVYTNGHMERGKIMEEEAREYYAFLNDIEPERVGFVMNGRKGCSPDSFVTANGMMEVKTALPHILIDFLLKNEFPPEHKAQCQGGLWVCEREWIDLIVYWPKLPPLIKRAYRDEEYIKVMSQAVDKFNEELDKMVETIMRYK
jgi:hypothetical protein